MDKWNFDIIKEEYYYIEREFSLNDFNIFSWSLSPESYEYTVILLHGFLDHSETNQTTIKWFLSHSYRVIAADMPGHGKSGGIRGGIDSFDTYRVYFKKLLDTWNVVPSITYALGHSTGASILMEYSRNESSSLRGMIFAAPLVKIGNHAFVVKGYDLAQTKIQEVPVKKMKSCKNRSFLKYKWNDSLGVKRFSISWVRAMVEWNKNWTDFISQTSVLILQGKKDHTVEWKNNIPILKRCFPQSKIVMIKKGRHHILNENERIGRIVYKEIESFLASND
jgi:alpha-beta hydrolase superfamily lysophospholipase